MHDSVLEWVKVALTAHDVAGKTVLEVGSYDVNGSVRPYIESLRPARYLGVDAREGPGVDQVVECEQLTETVGGGWDVVITTEMLEHVRNWYACIIELADAVTPGGLLLITTRSPGFPFHPHPEDHWRYTPKLMTQAMHTLDFLCTAIHDTDPTLPGVFVAAVKPANGWAPRYPLLNTLTAQPPR